MAKLSARGRKEIARFELERDQEWLTEQARKRGDFEPRVSSITGEPFVPGLLTVWERETRALMSDGKVLSKRDVRFVPDTQPWPGEEQGRRHSYGWTVAGKLKVSPEEWIALMSKRWTRVGA